MSVINVLSFAAESLPQGEILRYMRAGDEPSAEVISAAAEGERRVILAQTGRACYSRVTVKRLDEGKIALGELIVESYGLCKLLSGCDEAFVFAVTAGVGVDRAIRAAQTSGALSALATDAAGSALCEELCDMLCEKLSDVVDGGMLTKRFSAGYGDLSIEYQREIVRMLDTPKNIGVTLTGGVMMTPSKSVTAIVGIKNNG